MKRSFILSLMLGLSSVLLFAQNNNNETLKIPFLKTTPVIDGLPDMALNALDWQNFSKTEKTNNQNKDVNIRYKIGYNHSCLYLIIESNSESIIYRDRAYQNGDGFHIVIAKPDAGKPTDEFYVLRFSPSNASKNQPGLKGIWYYNIDLMGKTFGASTQFASQSSKGKSYFELSLSWNDVYPNHPLFSEGIGFNLCFVKAIAEKEKNYYFIKYDDKIQQELRKREYVPVKFEEAEKINNNYTLVRLDQNNLQAGNNVQIKAVSFAKTKSTVNYYISVRSADNYAYTDLSKEITLTEGKNTNSFVLPIERLAPDGYKVVWKSSDNSEGEIPLTILPEISFEKEKDALDKYKSLISEGDYNTMLFMLQNIMRDFKKVKRYETAGSIRERYLSYRDNLNELKKTNNLYANNRSICRRAFLSKIDTTLQPYSIKVPKDFDRKKKYPLFVFLHGSGSDDQGMHKGALTENNFIEIAPFGRGTSNCFTSDGAEIDVKEAIDDAIKNYPVDTSNIIIAGFSMGGYGAYRIFYEYPGLFKGVVVFSGHPNLASYWIGKGFPDFLETKYLIPFKNIPLFIYHSKNDLNCPYDITEQLVGKLRAAGANVEFVTTNEGGHGIIDNNNTPNYYNWLKNIVK